MDDYFLLLRNAFQHFQKALQKMPGRPRGANRSQKNIIILSITILMLCVSLFFYNIFDKKNYLEKKVLYSELHPLELSFDSGLSKMDILEIKYKSKEEKISPLEEKLTSLVSGNPIEKMIPEISRRPKKVAAFLIAIAKKESNWGVHSPKKKGKECYNYWGYKGNYNLSESGYSCFDSPEQAVQIVGNRISDLVSKKIDMPEKMLVWKCGSSCKGHDPKDVKKWIGDVRNYFEKIMD